MIVADIKHWQRYLSLDARLTKALQYLESGAWKNLKEGTHALDGEKLYVNVNHYKTQPEHTKKLETHNRYVDIQYLAEGEEAIGYAPREGLELAEAYDFDRDIAFWHVPREGQMLVRLKPGRFIILFPEDAHAPGLQAKGPCAVQKIVLKVLFE